MSLVRAVRERVERVRLLYLYPSGLSEELVDVIGESGCPYFDLSLQHVSGPLLRRMRRSGSGDRFLRKISEVRRRFPEAALRSSFIVGYPGETEEDHDALLCLPGAGSIGLGRPVRFLARRRYLRCRTARAKCRPHWWLNACGSVPNCRTPSRPESELSWWGPLAGHWSILPAWPGATGRRPRSTG